MRPPKLTEDIIDEIETALNIGASVEMAVNYAGVMVRTFYNWQKRGRELYAELEAEEALHEAYAEAKRLAKKDETITVPEKPKKRRTLTKYEKLYLQLFHVIETAKAVGGIQHLDYLRKLAPNNPNVSMWFLEKRYPEVFGRKERIELTGKDGGPIETDDLTEVPLADRAQRARQLLLLAAQRKAEAENGGKGETAVNDGDPKVDTIE